MPSGLHQRQNWSDLGMRSSQMCSEISYCTSKSSISSSHCSSSRAWSFSSWLELMEVKKWKKEGCLTTFSLMAFLFRFLLFGLTDFIVQFMPSFHSISSPWDFSTSPCLLLTVKFFSIFQLLNHLLGLKKNLRVSLVLSSFRDPSIRYKFFRTYSSSPWICSAMMSEVPRHLSQQDSIYLPSFSAASSPLMIFCSFSSSPSLSRSLFSRMKSQSSLVSLVEPSTRAQISSISALRVALILYSIFMVSSSSFSSSYLFCMVQQLMAIAWTFSSRVGSSLIASSTCSVMVTSSSLGQDSKSLSCCSWGALMLSTLIIISNQYNGLAQDHSST